MSLLNAKDTIRYAHRRMPSLVPGLEKLGTNLTRLGDRRGLVHIQRHMTCICTCLALIHIHM